MAGMLQSRMPSSTSTIPAGDEPAPARLDARVGAEVDFVDSRKNHHDAEDDRKGHVAVSRLEEDHDAHDEEEQSQQDRQPPAGDVGAVTCNVVIRIFHNLIVFGLSCRTCN